MAIKVSVVVPVFNAGEYIAASIDSLLAQTMPADELELIFVDDGSTDDTPALLDRLADKHAHVRVIHEPPSGWPGRPRNVGIEAAVGEYVQFLDQDDWLGEEALTRLYAMARRNDSDIVIGKMIGVRRNVPVQLFRKTWENVTIHDSPIIDSLTPHKMFRREFLLESGIRFPEGRRRLEDHVFVVAAYFAANRISVLSDYACYFHISRGDHGNAGYRPLEPRSYMANIAEALDVVDANTEPGPERDRLHRRWMRVEILARLRGGKLLRSAEDFREEFVREASTLVNSRFSAGVDAGLTPLERVVAGLLRADDLSSLLEFAQWESGLVLSTRVRGAQWRDGALVLDVVAFAVDGKGNLVELAEHGGSRLLMLPGPADGLVDLPLKTLDVSNSSVSLDLFARHTGTKVLHFLPGDASSLKDPWLSASTISRLLVSGEPGDGEPVADGVWEIHARLRAFGWTSSQPVTLPERVPGTPDPLGGPAVMGASPRLATPHRTAHGNVRVELATCSLTVPKNPPKIQVDGGVSMTKAQPRSTILDVTLNLATDRDRAVDVELVRSDPDYVQRSAAVLVHLPDGAGPAQSRLTATIAKNGLTRGQWRLRVSAHEDGLGLPIKNHVTVTRRRSVRLERVPSATLQRFLTLLPPSAYRRLTALRRRVISAREGRAT